MNFSKQKFALLMLSGVVLFSACKDDEEENPAGTMSVSSIATTDGTNLYGTSFATGVAPDQSIIIGFSAAVDGSSLGDVKILNGSNEVAATVNANGNNVTVDPTDNLFGGTQYTLQVIGVKSTDGGVSPNVSTTFTTSGIGLGTAPNAGDQQVYLQFNGNYSDVIGNANMVFSQNTWVEDRFGEANNALYLNGATTAGTGDIVEFSGNFIYPSSTISTWIKVNPEDYGASRAVFGNAVERAFYLEMGDAIGWIKFTTAHVVTSPANEYFGFAWTDPNGDGAMGGATLFDYEGSIADLVTTDWAQIVMTYDATTSEKTIYINGTMAMKVDLNFDPAGTQLTEMAIANQASLNNQPVPVDGIVPNLTFGYFCSPMNTATGWADYSAASNTFKGALDDFRIWNSALTQQQVTDFYNAEKVQ